MNPILKEDLMRIINLDLQWEKLRNATVMITGASGMVGSYFVLTLLQLNETKDMNIKVIGMVRNLGKVDDYIKNNKAVTLISHDVSTPLEYDGEIDYIIHAASPASPKIMKNDPVGTIAANTLGAFYTLQLAKDKNAKGYMFISSREIYGQPAQGQTMFTENTYGFVDPIDPRSCYPEGKKAAETMCSTFKSQFGLNTKIARLAHTYGPGMSIYDGRVQADFLKNVLNDEDIVLKSEGTSIRTYTYIADAISGMFYILLNGEDMVYNIGDENGKVSILELAQLLIDITPEKNLKLVFDIPKGMNQGCAPFTDGILCSGKLRKLGWKPFNNLSEGFRRTIKFLEFEKLK